MGWFLEISLDVRSLERAHLCILNVVITRYQMKSTPPSTRHVYTCHMPCNTPISEFHDVGPPRWGLAVVFWSGF